jgi:hypothetical protein
MLVMVIPSLPILMEWGIWVCAAAKVAVVRASRNTVERIINTSGSGL